MHIKDAIRFDLTMSDRVFNAYVGDLDDADLLVRPVPGMNHIAWQVGHLILSERRFVETVKPGSCPPLPADIEEGHGRKQFGVDDPAKFYSRVRYQELWNAQREATRRVLDETPESSFDDPREGLPPFASTVGNALKMCGTHAMMHVGQWVAVRRSLGKPVAI
jgi:hypothetical protein